MKYSALLGLLCAWLVSAEARTFHAQPESPSRISVLSGTGWMPTTQYDADPVKVGGTPEANARAQARAFPETIAFLKRTLGVDLDLPDAIRRRVPP